MSGKTCGDFGGLTTAGTPCTKQAGSGTEELGTGRCSYHLPSTLQAEKEELLEAIRGGTPYGDACELIGKDGSTVWRWRQADPAFSEALNAAMEGSDIEQMRRVEASLFQRILHGSAGQTLTIFWLVNKAAKIAKATGEETKWQHVYNVNANVSGGLKVPMGALEEAARRVTEEGDLGEEFVPEAVAQRMNGGASPNGGGGA